MRSTEQASVQTSSVHLPQQCITIACHSESMPLSCFGLVIIFWASAWLSAPLSHLVAGGGAHSSHKYCARYLLSVPMQRYECRLFNSLREKCGSHSTPQLLPGYIFSGVPVVSSRLVRPMRIPVLLRILRRSFPAPCSATCPHRSPATIRSFDTMLLLDSLPQHQPPQGVSLPPSRFADRSRLCGTSHFCVPGGEDLGQEGEGRNL